mgnify:CR=1 FL=1|tara:strand:+ start:629 stop:1225 length:597 start_codon:yes stop_codon:yes gene_type:complete
MSIGQMAGSVYGRGNAQGGQANQGSILPAVGDADASLSRITRRDWQTYVDEFLPFEMDLLDQVKNDTTLVDQAREDSARSATITQGIAERNKTRYGASLTPAQIQQANRTSERANTLGSIQAVNNAQLQQKEVNTAVENQLINLAQGLQADSISGVTSAAQGQANREAANANAKAASKAQMYQGIASLGSMAIFAMAF